MDGFRIFQLHIALKIHFTKANFSIFKNKGYLRGSYEAFLRRNDYLLYEKIGTLYNTPQEVIPFLASNLMYNNPSIVYDLETSIQNYTEYLRRKQSISNIFRNDLSTLVEKKIALKSIGQIGSNVLNLVLGKKITIESVRILDDFTGVVNTFKENANDMLLFNNDILRIEKSKGFVIYKKEKLHSIFMSYLNEEL